MAALANSTGIGQSVRRREDLRLVRGQGRYSDDENLPNQTYAVMVRSPHGHARIRGIDTAAALKRPGVIAVLTGADLLADGIKPIPHKVYSQHPAEVHMENKNGDPIYTAPHYALPADRARFVGEAVAVVVAETVAAAKDGAEHVLVDWEPLPAVTDTVKAAADNAPRLRDDNSNVCIDAEVGDPVATAAAFATAAHVVKLDTWIQRITGVPMEPRAALAAYDPVSGRTTLFAGNGGAVRLKQDLATILGVEAEQVRAVMHDIGGNFGTRGMIYPEFAVVAWAAKRVGRPVKWTCERHESFLADYQGRDLAVSAELALDADGNFLAMRGSNIGNLGAHPTNFSMLQKGVEIMSGLYRVPAAHFRARAVMSNTSPTRPYRSAGRPEVIYVMDRLIDLAARQCGFDRVKLRRRNLPGAKEMPYKNPFGMVYDSGDYKQVLESAVKLGDWAGFAKRKAAAKKRGKRLGIAVGTYVDTATGVPRERAEITVRPDGEVDVIIGTVSNGQGHETSFAQLVTEWLGIPIERVNIITGDTDIVAVGGGTHSGRGMRLGSIVIHAASQDIVAKGLRIAEHLLEAARADIGFADGAYTIKGTNRSVSLIDVARAAESNTKLPAELRGPLAAFSDQTIQDAAFPYGAHVCEVEVDPDTGEVTITRYAAVDDVGRAVNPLIIHGQVHGGIAQGVGQALWEHSFYDNDSGQLLAGSFMDYAMPRAITLPSFDTEISECPSPTHPLGIRPAGEGGTVPALGVTINAIVDALAEDGVTHIEMPATSERVWRAIHGKPDLSRSQA